MTEKLLDLPETIFQNMTENQKRACAIIVDFMNHKPDHLRIIFDNGTKSIRFVKVVEL